MALGKRIADRLQELGKPRRWLLEKVDGLTDQALSDLIRRDSRRSEWDEKIAAALGVSVGWLVYGHYRDGGNIERLVVSDGEHAPHVRNAINLLLSMSREGQYVAVGRLEELALAYPKENVMPAKS